MATRGRRPRRPKRIPGRTHPVRVKAHARSPRKKGRQRIRSYIRSKPLRRTRRR